jgi:flagellar biosynthetic protein FlhB
MPAGSDQEKTEKATPKKREDARKEGQVAVSREIPSLLILSSGLGIFFFAGAGMFSKLQELMQLIYQQLDTLDLHEASSEAMLIAVFQKIALLLAPLLIAIPIAGIVAHVAQFGFLFTTKSMAPKWDKLNPIKGLKKLFSIRSLAELIKSLVKIAIIGTVGYIVIRSEINTLPTLIFLSVSDIAASIGLVAMKLILYTCLILILLAGIDYAYQRWQYEKDLRMTKQEVKDEFKQREGDPKIKARIRSIQMEMSRRRMMDKVPEADVIITNPTHIAVALQFKPQEMPAPRVIAKGTDHLARRIKKLALEHDIPLVEDKPLARVLYKTVDLDGFIPTDLYRAVAEILAYVYRLKGRAT